MRFYLISDNIDTLVGMRMAGIEGVVVHDTEDVRNSLKSAIDDVNIGIVLITEKLMQLCPDLVYELKLNCKRPLIVEIPDRHGSGRANDSITRYVKEAIGVKI
jgi:V/A-type H+-transporting ATPase subunit F